jgi:hypothetical protein
MMEAAGSSETVANTHHTTQHHIPENKSQSQSVLVSGTHLGPMTNFFPFSLWLFISLFRVCWCGAPSLRRSRVCSSQFLPCITSAAFLRSESHGTHEHILLSLLLRLPQPGGPGSCIYFPWEQGGPVTSPGTGFLKTVISTELITSSATHGSNLQHPSTNKMSFTVLEMKRACSCHCLFILCKVNRYTKCTLSCLQHCSFLNSESFQ